jgi:dihydrofolate synthase/folylpolyglutamate synthase
LKEALQQYFKPAKSILLIGMSADKDMASVVAELSPVFDQVIATRAENPRSARPEVLAALFTAQGKSATTSESVPQALEQARQKTGKNDLICVTGSLFVVGEALKYLTKLPGNQD